MELSNQYAILLFVGLLLALLGFVASYTATPKKVLAVLAVIIPFEFIASRYGTVNIAITYLVFAGFFFRHLVDRYPLLLATGFIMVAYALSLVGVHRSTWIDHGSYLVGVISNFLLFYIAYNVFTRSPDLRLALRILIVMNVLCVGYSLILFFAGSHRVALLGIEALTLRGNLEDKGRLMGAFAAAGVTATFFALQSYVLLYAAAFVERGWMKTFCYTLVPVNFMLIVASGSRGSFLAFVAGALLFAWLMRRALGTARVVRLGVLGGIALATVSVYVVTQTDFDAVFGRLEQTEVSETWVPDSRQGAFGRTIERLEEDGRLLTGHGPRLRLVDEFQRRIPGFRPLGFYPHNLALFLVYTVGLVGLVAYAVFFGQLFLQFYRARRNSHPDPGIRYIPVLAMVFMATFFLDQLKIEFLRSNLTDFQHFIFFTMGTLLAFSRVAIAGRKKIVINGPR